MSADRRTPAGRAGTTDQPLTVLVVGDSPTQAIRVRLALQAAGLTVLAATDAREAVEIARGVRPDAVLCDVRMPRVDGFQLCTFFRADPQLAGMAFVLHGVSEADEDDEHARAAGAHAFAPKEVPHHALAPLLRQAVDAAGAEVGLAPEASGEPDESTAAA